MSSFGGRVRDTCRGNKFRIIVSDVCQAIAIFLVIISVAVGTAHPTPNFSWAKGTLNAPVQITDGNSSSIVISKATVDFGLTTYVICISDYGLGCQSSDLGAIEDSSCKAAGSGAIAAAVFAMLFGLISIFFLHAEANGKQFCGRRIPWPRTILFVFSFLSLLLYIVVVATWYEKCFNTFSAIQYYRTTPYIQNIHDGAAGYAIATAIAAIVFAFFSWAFAFWRTCRPNKAEMGGAGMQQQNGGVARSSSESVLAYAAPHMTPGNIAAAASIAGPIAAQQYGNAYSTPQDTMYSNNEPQGQGAYGGSSGGYGGSYGGGSSGGYGGAYGGGNEGAYGGGGKQQGAYGY